MKIKRWLKSFTFGLVGTFLVLSGYLVVSTVKKVGKKEEEKKIKE
jgi:hypothetical protein